MSLRTIPNTGSPPPTPPYETFGDVITAFELAGIDIRDAYWAGDHRPSDGSRRLLIRDNKSVIVIPQPKARRVESVYIDEDGDIIVELEL